MITVVKVPRADFCPICGAGPFKRLGTHYTQSHVHGHARSRAHHSAKCTGRRRAGEREECRAAAWADPRPRFPEQDELGEGRYSASAAVVRCRPGAFVECRCYVCHSVFYIRTKRKAKQYVTCSSPCSEAWKREDMKRANRRADMLGKMADKEEGGST